MTNAPEICNCCKEPIKGGSFASSGVGQVCRECGGYLRKAVQELHLSGMRNLYTGPCPDNQPPSGKEDA